MQVVDTSGKLKSLLRGTNYKTKPRTKFKELTLESCAQICSDKDMHFAGTANGTHCVVHAYMLKCKEIQWGRCFCIKIEYYLNFSKMYEIQN